MGGKTRTLLALAVLAFAISATHFLQHNPIPLSVTDFAGGMGSGLMIGVLISWGGERLSLS